MRLGVCAQVLQDLPLERAVDVAVELGIETIELPVDAGNPWIGGDASPRLWDEVASVIRAAGLGISALSVHQESQHLIGPDGSDPDVARRIVEVAELAQGIGVDVVIGFTGCTDWSRWFPWPLVDGYEQMGPGFRDAMMPVLDGVAGRGVAFAMECHPRQFAYNLETAEMALDLVGNHEALGFNFDPANLLLAGMEPEEFVVALGARIRHVHAKDGQLVRHSAARSGLLAHGAWDRPGRGFRFRVPGWGDLDWRSLITELQVAGYQGVLAVEHEDPTMSRREGLEQAVAHLRPIILRDPPSERFW